MIRIFLLILLFLPGNVYAQEAANFGDYAIAGTVKALAKVFVQTADLDKIKAKQIEVLTRMKEEKFNKRYAEFYVAVKDIPPELLLHYGMIKHLSKQNAIKEIQRADKRDLVEIIDKMPDYVIVKYIKDCLRQKADDFKNEPLIQQIDSLWMKFIQKA